MDIVIYRLVRVSVKVDTLNLSHVKTALCKHLGLPLN